MSLTALSNRALETKAKLPTEESIDGFYKLVDTIVGILGGKDQAADVMGIDRSDLTRTVKRNGRYLTIDHIIRLGFKLRESDQETAQRLAVALVSPMGFLVMTRTQMTASERKDRLLAYVRHRFPTGEEMISKALGPTDPCAQMTPAEVAHRVTEMLLKLPFGDAMVREAIDTPASAGEP